jgi:FlaA1/EpsC-like NDP-sugar epimerase
MVLCVSWRIKSIVRAVTYSIIAVVAVQYALTQDIYTRVLAITWMMHVILIGGSRFSWRVYADTKFKLVLKDERKRTLIVGAGAAGHFPHPP